MRRDPGIILQQTPERNPRDTSSASGPCSALTTFPESHHPGFLGTTDIAGWSVLTLGCAPLATLLHKTQTSTSRNRHGWFSSLISCYWPGTIPRKEARLVKGEDDSHMALLGTNEWIRIVVGLEKRGLTTLSFSRLGNEYCRQQRVIGSGMRWHQWAQQ